MSKLNVAVVGLGAIGREHADIYASLPGTELVALVDPAVSAQVAESRWPGVPLVASIDALLSDDHVQAVSLCTPDHVHHADATRVMRSGRHLLLEKPIASDPDEAADLLATADSCDVVAMPGHTLRYEPRYHHAREVVGAQGIGEVMYGYVRRNNKVSVAARAAGRVSVAFFLGIHDIDAVQWITGQRVLNVQARETTMRDASGRQSVAIMSTLGLESGALVQLEAAWGLPENNPTDLDARFRLVGREGELSIDSYDSGIRVTGDTFSLPMPGGAPLYGRAHGPLRDELEGFVDACLRGERPPISMREAAQAVMVVDAIERAIGTGGLEVVRQL